MVGLWRIVLLVVVAVAGSEEDLDSKTEGLGPKARQEDLIVQHPQARVTNVSSEQRADEVIEL
jgi:hypothetical protein